LSFIPLSAENPYRPLGLSSPAFAEKGFVISVFKYPGPFSNPTPTPVLKNFKDFQFSLFSLCHSSKLTRT